MSPEPENLSQNQARHVLAWDGPTRAFKWALVFVVFDGWLSNKIGGHIPLWHKWNGYCALILIMFRLFWGFYGGSTALFSNFIPWPRQSLYYIRRSFRGMSIHYLGHNPVGAWMVVALLALVAFQAITGLYAGDDDRLVIEGPLAKTVSDAIVALAASWHRLFFWLIEIFVAIHVAANVLQQAFKKDPLISAMITGRKKAQVYQDAQTAVAGSWTAASLCLVAAIAVVLGGIMALGGNLTQ